jgi:hypothetical protein
MKSILARTLGVLMLAATLAGCALPNATAAAMPTPPTLELPATAVGITFDGSVSYAAAVRAVTDAGLQLGGGCLFSGGIVEEGQPVVTWREWVPQGQVYTFAHLHQLGAFSTPLSRPDALRQVEREARVTQIQMVYGSECGGSFLPSPPDHLPPALLDGQQGSYALASFASGTAYDAAVDGVENLGLRLADRCYEVHPTLWHPMGQEANFAQTTSLVIATTYYSPIAWQSLLLQLPGASQIYPLTTRGC